VELAQGTLATEVELGLDESLCYQLTHGHGLLLLFFAAGGGDCC
jgi:hypothetical protein